MSLKIILTKGAVQLLRNALGGRGEAMVWHFVTGGVGRALRTAYYNIYE